MKLQRKRITQAVAAALTAGTLVFSNGVLAANQEADKAAQKQTQSDQQTTQKSERGDKQLSAQAEAELKGQANLVRAGKLTGAEVRNQQGENLGDVEDFVVDNSGKIKYILLSSGGFLDIGDNIIAVPFNAMKLENNEGKLRLTMNATKQQLSEAPNFELDNWPNWGSENWMENVDAFYTQQGLAPVYASQEREDRDELRAEAEGNIDASFGDLDQDQDSYISRKEAESNPDLIVVFADLDQDGDDKLSQSEYQQASASASAGKQDTASMTASTDAQSGGQLNASFSQLDQDQDGEISRKEAQDSEKLSQEFANADQDNNGKISQSEFSAFETGGNQQGSQSKSDKPNQGQDKAQSKSQDKKY